MPKDRSLYLPVLVGAVNNWSSGLDYQRDDDGENISDKNPNYNELTAIFWAWKNLHDTDVIGLMHYRRYFVKNRNKLLNRVDIEKLLKDKDILVPQKRKYYIETNYTHYIHAHKKEPLEETREIIRLYYPSYLLYFDQVMQKRSAHMFNMFIMKEEPFKDYCTWLFSILEKLECKIDISRYSVQEARVFGYISELLLDVWIEKNNVKFGEIKWHQIGPKHTIRKILAFVGRKFNFGSKRTHFGV